MTYPLLPPPPSPAGFLEQDICPQGAPCVNLSESSGKGIITTKILLNFPAVNGSSTNLRLMKLGGQVKASTIHYGMGMK
jgi:hypothetical protein